MTSLDDLSNCLVLNTIAAARTRLRMYDLKLKPFGVTAQQFWLLAAIQQYPEESVGALAQKVSLDRTSLTRNLDLLERMGLVRRISGREHRARYCELTDAGAAVLERILPEWKRAQEELMGQLNAEDAATFLSVARQLARN